MGSINLGLDTAVNNFFKSENIQNIAASVLENLKNVGIFLSQIVVALLLSYVFIIERKKISTYLKAVEYSNFAFLYYEYEIIFSKVQKGFGLIFKAQSIIAVIDSILTFLGLLFISFLHGDGTFPYILTLSVMVFIFGFIPVLGVFLSSVPMAIIAYTFGGIPILAATVILIVIIHIIDAYYLSPRIVSSYMEFPMFVTFVVLLMSEHLFGFVGLLIGIPLYYILVDILRDFNGYLGKVKVAHAQFNELKADTKRSLSHGIRLSRSGKR